MTTARGSAARSVPYGDWVITLAFLAMMGGAYGLSLNWPPHTAFFPQLLAITGMVMCLVQLGLLVWQARTRPPAPEKERYAANGEVALVEGDEEQGNEDEFHKVFTHADGRSWAACLGWVGLFFAAMHLIGILATLPVFTVLYLRVVAKASWRTCLLYVLGTAGVMYLLFVMFLHLPLPQGILFGE
ncbi:tripartite tricarboxylate transporter TctB family protein [Ancylobacter terrae]|uniref:tripartite tricarboxylate transporter TctB family protein n=1 Tax=Ancylobacter sp. sgz301288 TaxID=3342077 RepID=UPI00385AFB54